VDRIPDGFDCVANGECNLATQPPWRAVYRQLRYFYIMKEAYARQLIKETVAREEAGAEVILYGSRARGTAGEESDWDILVLLDQPSVDFKDEQRIRHSLYPIELELETPISVFAYSRNDWNTRLKATPLYAQIQKEGIRL
jgi:predicted nucleotidyltransferase